METLKKLLDLLSRKDKKKIQILTLLILITAIIDTIGIASIFPFITLLSNPQLLETNFFLVNLFKMAQILGIKDSTEFLYFLGVFSLFFLIFSLIVRAVCTYFQYRFSLMCEYSIGKSLVEKYLHQPYEWFLDRNSAEIGKNILLEVREVVEKGILPSINILAYGIACLCLIILLVLIDPYISLIMSLSIMICYLISFYFVKKILSKLSIRRSDANKKRNIIINEAFGASKEIKIIGKEEFYIKNFEDPAKKYATSHSLAVIIGLLPRYIIEGFAFGGMIFVILLFMSKENSFSNLIPIISVYAFAGYRLMPALQNIYFAATQLRFSGAALINVHSDFKSLNLGERYNKNQLSLPFNKSIELKNISFSYNLKNRSIIKNVSFKIPAFSKVGIVGATGSGKSTVIDIILGLLTPNHGNLYVDDIKIDKNNLSSWQKKIGYVPQQIYLSDESIISNIALGTDKDKIDYNQIVKVSKIANLHEFIDKELPNKYDTLVGERGVRLSGGQRQRIGIARALYHKPSILVLDEATSALDNLTENSVLEAVLNFGKNITILLVAHRLTTVKNCDNIFFFEKGKMIANGNFNELIKKNEQFKKMVLK